MGLDGKLQYIDIIVDGIVTLKDRKGSSRQGLWKCVSGLHTDADYKQFLVRLKKASQEGLIDKNGFRYRLSQKFKSQLQRKPAQEKVKKTKATQK